MEKTELLSRIRKTHARIRDLTIASGIGEKHVDKMTKSLEDKTEEELLILNTWLEKFENGPYADMLSIWRLKPSIWWSNMEFLFQQHDTREQLLLRDERKKIRRAWKKHYRETYNEDEDQEGQESIQDTPSNASA